MTAFLQLCIIAIFTTNFPFLQPSWDLFLQLIHFLPLNLHSLVFVHSTIHFNSTNPPPPLSLSPPSTSHHNLIKLLRDPISLLINPSYIYYGPGAPKQPPQPLQQPHVSGVSAAISGGHNHRIAATLSSAATTLPFPPRIKSQDPFSSPSKLTQVHQSSDLSR